MRVLPRAAVTAAIDATSGSVAGNLKAASNRYGDDLVVRRIGSEWRHCEGPGNFCSGKNVTTKDLGIEVPH